MNGILRQKGIQKLAYSLLADTSIGAGLGGLLGGASSALEQNRKDKEKATDWSDIVQRAALGAGMGGLVGAGYNTLAQERATSKAIADQEAQKLLEEKAKEVAAATKARTENSTIGTSVLPITSGLGGVYGAGRQLRKELNTEKQLQGQIAKLVEPVTPPAAGKGTIPPKPKDIKGLTIQNIKDDYAKAITPGKDAKNSKVMQFLSPKYRKEISSMDIMDNMIKYRNKLNPNSAQYRAVDKAIKDQMAMYTPAGRSSALNNRYFVNSYIPGLKNGVKLTPQVRRNLRIAGGATSGAALGVLPAWLASAVSPDAGYDTTDIGQGQ